MWQLNQRKSAFIAAAMAGDRSVRTIEESSSQTNSFAFAKAIASGNPLLMQKAGLDAEIARLTRLASAHNDDQWALRNSLLSSRDAIRFAQEHIESLTEDQKKVVDTSGDLFRMTVFGKHVSTRADAGAYLEANVMRLPNDPAG